MDEELKKTLRATMFALLFGALAIGLYVVGVSHVFYVQGEQTGAYDLYQCIENNARMNGYPQHPEMIRKVQDECICFREHNYTNLMEAGCA